MSNKDNKTSFVYDQEADLLTIHYIPPYIGQETEEVEDGIVAYMNPDSGVVEGLQIMGFRERFSSNFELILPQFFLPKKAG